MLIFINLRKDEETKNKNKFHCGMVVCGCVAKSFSCQTKILLVKLGCVEVVVVKMNIILIFDLRQLKSTLMKLYNV